MKQDTGFTLLVLFLLVVAVVAFSIWSASAADAAALQVNATAAGSQMPEAVMVMSQVAGWAISAVIGIVVAAVVAWLVGQAKNLPKILRSQRKWKSGPNANFQTERAPRQVSDMDLMRAMMYQQMMAGQKQQPRQQMQIQQNLPDDLGNIF